MPARDDRGAALVFALIFLAVGSLISVALAQFATENFTATGNIRTARVVNYAADAAIDGAIQQTRYHGACESFPKAGSLQLATEFLYVGCSSTPLPVVTAQATAGSTTLTTTSPFTFTPSPEANAYALTAQPVVDSAGSTVATISAVTSATSATMSAAATSTGTVYVGAEGERFDTFTACASTSSLSSCTSTQQPEATVEVMFQDVNSTNSPAAEVGYTATVIRWVVRSANA